MPLPDDRDAFEAAFRAAVATVLPSASVEVVAGTIVAIKLRVDLDEDRFIASSSMSAIAAPIWR
jgi:hypothetical protein